MRIELRSYDNKVIRELPNDEVVVFVQDDGREIRLAPDPAFGALFALAAPAEGGGLGALHVQPQSSNTLLLRAGDFFGRSS